jgi:substrate import-associated zinc metallohydrolase lipoprotein
MKLRYLSFIVTALLAGSCSDPYNDALDESKLNFPDNERPASTPLDNWLFDNFTAPYNIEVKYRWDASELAVTQTLVPPATDKVLSIMSIVKDTWVVPYTTEAGQTFLKTFCPKQFVLVGSPNFNSNGTITLGTAEGGRKIVLYVINDFEEDSRRKIKEQMHTVHHEFAHILHQNILYPANFKEITRGDYTADWTNISTAEAQSKGFITPYAMSAPDEDFVEIIAMMLTEGKRGFDRIVCSIPSATGQALIREKEQIVVAYFSNVYHIDFYKLQDRTDKAIDFYAPKTLLAELGLNQAQNFNEIRIDPAALPALPAAFKAIYDDAAYGLSAVEGAGRVLDFVLLYFTGDDQVLLEFVYHNASGDQFAADFYYDITVDANHIVTFHNFGRNANADIVASGLQPLIDYFEDNTFYFDWIPNDSGGCVVDYGGIFPQGKPELYSFGLLKN